MGVSLWESPPSPPPLAHLCVQYIPYLSRVFFLFESCVSTGKFFERGLRPLSRQPGRIFSEKDREGRRALDKRALVHSPKIAYYRIYQDSLQCTNYIKRTFFAGGHETKALPLSSRERERESCLQHCNWASSSGEKEDGNTPTYFCPIPQLRGQQARSIFVYVKPLPSYLNSPPFLY